MAEPKTLRPGSLLARTNLTLAVSSLLIVVIAIAALNFFVIDPIAEQSADDESALLARQHHSGFDAAWRAWLIDCPPSEKRR